MSTTTIITIVMVLVGACLMFAAGKRSSRSLPPEDISDESIEQKIIAGQTLQAIKLYRFKYNTGLKEAKDAVDKLREGYKQSGRIKS